MDAGSSFSLVYSSAFKRDIKSYIGRNRQIYQQLLSLLAILEKDPYNNSKKHHIKKLTQISAGEGEWRIRSGKYRLRYDIFGKDVVLYSFTHRKDAY